MEYFSYLQLQNTVDFATRFKNNVYCTDDVDRSRITSFAQLKPYVQAGKCTAYTVKSAAGTEILKN